MHNVIVPYKLTGPRFYFAFNKSSSSSYVPTPIQNLETICIDEVFEYFT